MVAGFLSGLKFQLKFETRTAMYVRFDELLFKTIPQKKTVCCYVQILVAGNLSLTLTKALA